MSGETYEVKDRRAFNPDGTPRDQAPEGNAEAEVKPAETTAESSAPPPHPHQLPPVEFVMFTFQLIAEAFACMGVGQEPIEGRPMIDLPIAKHLIDTLGMLQEKTKGNLTADENRHLSDALRDLRLQYVSLLNSQST